MQDSKLYEYAVIRVVPFVEREEFMNIGVILYCASEKYLKVRYLLNESRLLAFAPIVNIEEIKNRLKAFDLVCEGNKDGGPIALLPLASRFRWLTAARSTIIQVSAVHPGLCFKADETLDKLMNNLVETPLK